uniref:CCHC-type domain-containing protein n=1 Tax=Trichogramma kaykai TaxID=54128 RepID=A0ABD2W6S6_9HYME
MIERDDHVYKRTLRAAQRDAVTRPMADRANALSDEQVSAELQQRGLIVSPEPEINRDRLLRALCYSADKHCSMQWDNERDGVLPVFMPATSMSPSKGAIKRPSAIDKQTNKSKRSPKDRSRSEEVRTRIFTSRAATPRPKELEPALTSGLPAPLIPTIAMWPAADEQVREAPANNTAAATDFFQGPELTPPETPRRDAKSRENASSLSPGRSESGISDGAQTIVQTQPPQPSMTDRLLHTLIHEIRALSVNQADHLLAINMRLDNELVPRTSSNASRRSSHSSRHNSGKSDSDVSRASSFPRESSSHHPLRDITPHVDERPAVKTSLSRTPVVKEHRSRDDKAQGDGDTTLKSTKISKMKKIPKKRESVVEASSSSGESNTHSRKRSTSPSPSVSDGGKSRTSRRSQKTKRCKKRGASSSSPSEDEVVQTSPKRSKVKKHKKRRASSSSSSSSSTSCSSSSDESLSSESSSSESPSSDDSSSDSDASRHHRKGKRHRNKKAATKKSKNGSAKTGDPGKTDDRIMKRLQNWKISFAGGDRAKAEMFITRLAKCRAGSRVDDQRLIDTVHATLSGEADLWYRAARPTFKTWERFESSFRKMFIGKLGEFKLLHELRNRKQGEDESIMTFIMYFNFYLTHLTEKLSRREKVRIVWNNIRPEYCSALCNRMPKSLKKIQKAGERYEDALAISKNFKRNESETILPLPAKSSRQTQKIAAVSEVEEESSVAKDIRQVKTKKKRAPKTKEGTNQESVASVQNTPTQAANPGQQRQATTNVANGEARGNNARFVGACFTCSETGHRASKCPQRRCYRCNENGHLAPQCTRAPPTACQVCGTPNVEFRNCERCTPFRQAWGNAKAGRQDSPMPAPPRSAN